MKKETPFKKAKHKKKEPHNNFKSNERNGFYPKKQLWIGLDIQRDNFGYPSYPLYP